MRRLATIGDPVNDYNDRPTVKVVIWREDTILLLNNGLLPGGGIDAGESDVQAIDREVAEELGARVTDVRELSEVVQYRDFLKKRYVVRGYSAQLRDFTGIVQPQDSGETAFRLQWLPLPAARELVGRSIAALEKQKMTDDSVQGKLYNLRTTAVLLAAL